MSSLALIAAIGRDGVIGRAGGHLGLPWHIPEDLKRFRKLTTGHAIIMGRRTFEMIGRPLPRRRNIVLSRAPYLPLRGVEHARDLDAALRMASDDPMPFIIGGAMLYREALPRCRWLFLTEVDREVTGDAYFPEFDRTAFREVEREAAETEGVVFVTLERTGEAE